jgi:hypothetical protein
MEKIDSKRLKLASSLNPDLLQDTRNSSIHPRSQPFWDSGSTHFAPPLPIVPVPRPLNRERRFVPSGSTRPPLKAPWLYVKWLPADREEEYAKLLEACRPPAKPTLAKTEAADKRPAGTVLQLECESGSINAYAFSLESPAIRPSERGPRTASCRCLPRGASSGRSELSDFNGQADQRLIHQLYMEDTALAVLVFDGQKEDLFESLGQWDRDITRSSSKPFAKLLAAGGGLGRRGRPAGQPESAGDLRQGAWLHRPTFEEVSELRLLPRVA